MWIILVCLAAISAATGALPLILQPCPCGFTNQWVQNYHPYWGQVSQYRPMYTPMFFPVRSVDPFSYMPRQFTVRFLQDTPKNKTNDIEACFASCRPDEVVPEKNQTVQENTVAAPPCLDQEENDNEQMEQSEEIGTSSCALPEAPETKSAQQTQQETTPSDSEKPEQIIPESTNPETEKEKELSPSSSSSSLSQLLESASSNNQQETEKESSPSSPSSSSSTSSQLLESLSSNNQQVIAKTPNGDELPEETPVTELTRTTQSTEPERKAALEAFISSGYITESRSSDDSKSGDTVPLPKDAPESENTNQRAERSKSEESSENLV